MSKEALNSKRGRVTGRLTGDAAGDRAGRTSTGPAARGAPTAAGPSSLPDQDDLRREHRRWGHDHIRCYRRRCQSCRRTFFARHPIARNCSTRCARTIAQQRRLDRERAGRRKRCGRCGDAFRAKRRDAAYCSSPCRQAAYRERSAGASEVR